MGGVNDVPVVGQPLAYGVGFLVLLIVGFTGIWGRSLTTVAHEGGHMLVSAFTFRGHRGFVLNEDGSAVTTLQDGRWGLGYLLTGFAGYATPPLLGLGGAALIAAGNAFAVFAILALFLFLAFFFARNALAGVVTAVALGVVVAVAVWGSVRLQAGIAVGAVWLLLFNGTLDAFRLPLGGGSDAEKLAESFLLPAFVWKLAWIAIAVVSLVAGARLLLVPTT